MNNLRVCLHVGRGLLALSVLLGLTGCDQLLAAILVPCDYEADPACEDPERGHITGLIELPPATSAHVVQDPAARATHPAWAALRRYTREHGLLTATRPAKHPVAAPVQGHGATPSRGRVTRPGELIVGLAPGQTREDIVAGAAPLLSPLSVSAPLCAGDRMCLLKLRDEKGRLVSRALTDVARDRLNETGAFRYVEDNLVLTAQRTPNDDFYPFQWHYQAMNLEGAWDLTVGSDDVVAAVVDTGLLRQHPDLDLRIAGGADLIDDEDVAVDGDGRDMDFEDVGDQTCGADCHSHHGSHVAGTMAAKTNNASLVSGVTWLGKILGVRVLGKGGGSLFDIASGVLWSIGENVDGVSVNEQPADVINMSLGGTGTSKSMNEAVAAAIDAGALVIVAAGNEDRDASESTPANAPGAITVAALGNVGPQQPQHYRAPYSNHGTVVDVAAPGGDQTVDQDGDGHADGVLSTVKSSAEYYQGTSMAAPHVAGLAMLLKSQSPDLTQEEALGLLTSTADPDVDCDKPCGAGLVDAAKALLTLDGRADEPLIVAAPASVRVGRGDDDVRVGFKNLGGTDVEVTVSLSGPRRGQVRGDTPFGMLDVDNPVVVNIASEGAVQFDLDIERTASGGDDAWDDEGQFSVTAVWGGGTITESKVRYSGDTVIATRQVVVGALKVEDNGEFTVERAVVTSEVDDYAYKLFNLNIGNYLVVGLTDDDDDGELEENEGVGVYPIFQQPELVMVVPGQATSNTNFVVAASFDGEEVEGTGDGAVGAACVDSADCDAALYCETVFFPGGYCTQSCSGGGTCPGDALCFAFDSEYAICLDGCETDDDCRTDEGYVCDADNTCYP